MAFRQQEFYLIRSSGEVFFLLIFWKKFFSLHETSALVRYMGVSRYESGFCTPAGRKVPGRSRI